MSICFSARVKLNRPDRHCATWEYWSLVKPQPREHIVNEGAFFKIHKKFKQHPSNIKNYTAHPQDMMHVPGKSWDNTAMRLLTVRKWNVIFHPWEIRQVLSGLFCILRMVGIKVLWWTHRCLSSIWQHLGCTYLASDTSSLYQILKQSCNCFW